MNFIESNYTDLKLDYQKFHCMSEKEKLKELKNILNAFLCKTDEYELGKCFE